jgi:hypothetical protein
VNLLRSNASRHLQSIVHILHIYIKRYLREGGVGTLHVYIYKERENRFITLKCERAVHCGLVSGVRMFVYSDCFVYSHTVRADLLMT